MTRYKEWASDPNLWPWITFLGFAIADEAQQQYRKTIPKIFQPVFHPSTSHNQGQIEVQQRMELQLAHPLAAALNPLPFSIINTSSRPSYCVLSVAYRLTSVLPPVDLACIAG